jgi:hypothetical protein
LLGLKENVIIGKVIPADTGMPRYRNVMTRINPEALPEWWVARKRELQEAREAEDEGPLRRADGAGPMTREEAERALADLGPRRPRVDSLCRPDLGSGRRGGLAPPASSPVFVRYPCPAVW